MADDGNNVVLYEVQTKSDGDCFFEAIALALRKNPQHYACFHLGLKYQCHGRTITSQTIRRVVADSIYTLPSTAAVWETWQNCVAVPEMRVHDYAFAAPLLHLQGQNIRENAKNGIEIPMHIRESMHDNMMCRRYWADQYAVLTVARVLHLNIYVVEIEHNRTAIFKQQQHRDDKGFMGGAPPGMQDGSSHNSVIVVNRREHYTLLARDRAEYMFDADTAAAVCNLYLARAQDEHQNHQNRYRRPHPMLCLKRPRSPSLSSPLPSPCTNPRCPRRCRQHDDD